jgi:formylglycine-generating enzyme required for sulfatase activity
MGTRQRVWLLLSLAVGVCVAPACFAQRVPQTPVPYGNSWALLIGINRYRHLPEHMQLRYAVNDVVAMREVLVDHHGFPEANVVTLIDDEATQEGIEDAMADLADPDRIKANDRVLVYFSGHGATVPLPGRGPKGFLITHDAEFKGDGSTRNPSDYYRTCIGMDRLRELSSFIPAKHTLFLVDACYSGAATRAIEPLPMGIPGHMWKVSTLSVAQVITAGLSGEQVVEFGGHGAFTFKLLAALKDGYADTNMPDGVTTATELGTYLSGVVPPFVDEVAGRQQHPHFGRYRGEGEFLFLHPVSPNSPAIVAVETAQPAISQPAARTSPRQDHDPPVIEVATAIVIDRVLIVQAMGEVVRFSGVVTDNTAVASVEVDGHLVPVRIVQGATGQTVKFSVNVDMVRRVRREVLIRATDTAGNVSSRPVLVDFYPGAPAAKTMALIRRGGFWMGASERDAQDDEYPRREVRLDAYYIDRHEVTVGQYRKFVETTRHRAPDWKKVARYSPTDQHPMVLVSWSDATAYAKSIGKRLPTEAEWERAAAGRRGDRAYPWGDGAGADHANFKGVEDADRWRYSAPVGSFGPNEYDVYDLGGNVWEWCSDGYRSDYYSRSPDQNPAGPEKAQNHVVRGGSWDHPLRDLRVSNRQAVPPSSRYGDLGFRCVADAFDDEGRPRDPLELPDLE